jgi:CheY-like chemotaxis protein
MQNCQRAKNEGPEEIISGKNRKGFLPFIGDRIMKKKILVVEDEESLRLLYEEELTAEGYEVLTAGNGKEAILQLQEGKPDLVILDIVMPVMDGIETLGRILGKGRKIPIILHTSYPGYREDLMSWAADAYITKSSDLKELKNKVRELLEKKKD